MTTGDAGRLATNRLLTALPPAEWAYLRPHMEPVPLGVGQVLYRTGEPIAHVYFPRSGVVSLLTSLGDGSAIAVGLVGREGMVGLPVVLGADTTRGDAICLLPGDALRLGTAALRERLREAGALRERLARYTHERLVETAQAIACSRRHTVVQRCACWLLMTHDRVDGDSFPLTHRSLGAMLGVRRATVTAAAGALQRTGGIAYHSGRVTVCDRARLEAAACECYGVVCAILARLR